MEQTRIDEARQRVLRSTVELAARSGYRKTSFAQIARSSGVSAGFITWHFGNKDALFAAALDSAYRDWSAAGTVWSARGVSGERVERLVTNLSRLRRPTADMDYWRVGLMLASDSDGERSRGLNQFLELRHRSFDFIRGWWADSTSADLADRLAVLTLAALDGLAVWRRNADDEVGSEATIGRMLAVGLEAAAVRLESGASSSSAVPELSMSRDPGALADPILDAAERVLVAGTVESATIARIAELAGLPVTSVYWRHGDKEGLIEAVARAVGDRWERRYAEAEASFGVEGPATALDFERCLLAAHDAEPNLLALEHLLLIHSDGTGAAARAVFALHRSARRRRASLYGRLAIARAGAEPTAALPLVSAVSEIMTDGLRIRDLLDGSSSTFSQFAPDFAAIFDAVAAVSAADPTL